ncbi:Glutamate--tRNA ligase 2 [Candidatus Terasakiella magnetica]|uniref:Glutamate--tRNA ligase n=1 Tax=Candidatus Terasakiella magnetica TaxID=1867952 RepID=A0A1C3RCN9_9PROT|nr:glutamate--tRNA ligase [Candidatus Terasakiella magnetica]SCA55040.1 Glutamate--tRNA ligase 2 [Candidatus Terasakiella magnetica]
MSVVTRFAPSPTGYLHIGGARTALFNWLYARRHNGKFLLRIEDTDRERSTDDAVEKIYEGLNWLGLDWDGDAVSQFDRRERHAEVAQQLLDEGKAYYCYCTPEELTEMREKARAQGRTVAYDRRWRDSDATPPEGVKPVVRLKAPLEGETVIEDSVQGDVKVSNDKIDDMILLRGDGTPTYMLAVVVDDHDMGVTHAIRGDDHLTNAFRQKVIYDAMGWETPQFAHIPLIHGSDGKKLSKRHGALAASSYRDEGFLPEAMCNYLLRLGWGRGDEEFIPRDKAIEWFDLDGIGKAPARFDTAKLTALNFDYIRQSDDARLAELVLPLMKAELGEKFNSEGESWLVAGMPGLKERAKTLLELAESASFYMRALPFTYNDKALKLMNKGNAKELLAQFVASLDTVSDWTQENLENAAKSLAEKQEVGLGKIAQPIRVALTGSTVSPSVFEVMAVLGHDETVRRLTSEPENQGE